MQFGTNAFKHMTAKQLAAKYVEVRGACLATEYGKKFGSAERFDEFVAHYTTASGIRRQRELLLSAFGQLRHAYTKSHFSPPSPETLQWGGFLGGEWHHDTKDADAMCWKVLNS